jgi:hypothetical protein
LIAVTARGRSSKGLHTRHRIRRFCLIELLDGLRDMRQILVGGQTVSADGTHRIQALGGYDDAGEHLVSVPA